MKKVLITGINGSAASYLAEYLQQSQSVDIHGTARAIPAKSEYTIHQCDLTDFSAVYDVLKKIEPDYIFHLASNADVKMSFTNPLSVYNNNVNSTLVLLEVLHKLEMKPLFQMCSTSEVYGAVKESPITEEFPLNPANIYAVSKLSQEKLARFYWEAYGLPVVITRAFGYINPRRKNIFSTAFATQIVRIEAGLSEPVMNHGNLDSIRTLLDVRDVASAYWHAMQECENGVPYNVGSEHGVSVKEILNELLKRSSVKIKLVENQSLLRPNDVTLQIPSVSKFKRTTTWVPRYRLEDSLDYLMRYCRENYVKK